MPMLTPDPHAAAALLVMRAHLITMQTLSLAIVRELTDLSIPTSQLGVCYAASCACAEIGYKLARAIGCIDQITQATERNEP